MMRCKDCGTIIPAAETKFKVEDAGDPGPVMLCNACFLARQRKAEGKPAKKAEAKA